MDIGTRTNEQHDRKYETFKVEQGTLDPDDEFKSKNVEVQPTITSKYFFFWLLMS